MQVDDGFWEGELNGHVGVFPSLMVELVHDEGEDEEEKEEMQVRLDPDNLNLLKCKNQFF